ncbi:DUF6519 domain-containing protein [Paraburkholderia sp. JHI869]|uniref:DUF6519 domain-containing protein n=1 Tax=Paraburkholderia sp. JHI869 TaxID=3112959 RepID=UPI0031790102
MSGDYSRCEFDSSCNFQGVLLQQGRPLTDADWNELVAESFRLAQASMLDTFGGAALVPMSTPNAFQLAFDSTGALTIGAGRIYVDGLLAQNHGSAPYAWDPKLAENAGTLPTPYLQQPYLPNPRALPANGTSLAYLDVWRREVTQYEAPQILEPALGGVDTTARTQLIWQVKLLPLGGNAGALTCSSTDGEIPGWGALIAPSAGRLSTQTAAYGSTDPCIIPPMGGYTGLENQLYRIEIHDPGAPGTATFKWSRDNASVEARVLTIVSGTSFTVDSVGRDAVLGLQGGDWIELTDNAHELNGLPGLMLQIATNGVDRATLTITVTSPIDPAPFPVGTPDPALCTRVRSWNQQGEVLRTDTSPPSNYVNADTNGGVIPVPATNTVTISLENSIVALFDIAAPGGLFRTGDYWVFAARTSNASIETLVEAPPRGIHHHYARLGFVSAPPTVPADCRQFWPPQGGAAESCACTVCVSPQSHAQGTLTIPSAVQQVIKMGGGTVCLEAGQYTLAQPVMISGAKALTLRGQRAATQLSASAGMGFIVTGSTDVTLADFALQGVTPAPNADGNYVSDPAFGTAALAIDASQQITLRGLDISEQPQSGAAAANDTFAAVACSNLLDAIRFEDNNVTTPVGLFSAAIAPAAGADGAAAGAAGAAAPASPGVAQYLQAGPGAAVLGEIDIVGNRFACAQLAIMLQPQDGVEGNDAVLPRVTIIDNAIIGCVTRAIALGQTGPKAAAAIRIERNTFAQCGVALWAAAWPNADLSMSDNTITASGNALTPVSRTPGAAISGEVRCVSVSQVASFCFADNRLDAIAQTPVETTIPVSAIYVEQTPVMRLARNQMTDIGPARLAKVRVSAVGICGPFETLDLHDNLIRTTNWTVQTGINPNGWSVILIDGSEALPAAPITEPVGTAAFAGTVNVHSNRVEAAPGSIVAMIGGVTTCHYTNNASQTRQPNTRGVETTLGEVMVMSTYAVVGNNTVIAALRIAAIIGRKTPAVTGTVLGNVFTGPVQMNGGSLTSPWATLNQG